MRISWTGLRRPPVPVDVVAAIAPRAGERLLAWALDVDTATTVVAGSYEVYAVSAAPDRAVTLARPWRMVDAGAWDTAAGTLTVTWVDGAARSRWVMPEPGLFPEAFRERVMASVVVAEDVDLGQGRTARVCVRSDLATGALSTQTLLGRGVRASDPGVLDATRAAAARLREQVGL